MTERRLIIHQESLNQAIEDSRGQAIKMTETMLINEFNASKASGQIKTDKKSYDAFVQDHIEYERMLNELVRNMNIGRTIASYALLKTAHKSVDAAVDFLFELDDADKMQHQFVPYLPTKMVNDRRAHAIMDDNP